MNRDYSLCRFFCDPSSTLQLSSLRSGGEADRFCTFELDTTPRILPNNSYPKQVDDLQHRHSITENLCDCTSQ